MNRDEWLARRTFRGAAFDPERLAARASSSGLTVSVCLPTREVARTVGPILGAVRDRFMGARPLVHELAIVDSRSADDTVRLAREAGARVLFDDEILPELGRAAGKGEALYKSLAALRGDIVVWLDADVSGFDPAFVPGLLGPLLELPEIGFVKGLYRRPVGDVSDEGGRVTEICARPLLNLLHPELAGFVQPLAGEQAGRRALLERVPFFTGYAVELGLLVDLRRRFGLGAMAQVDLGERRHYHQPTAALGRMAATITQAMLRRLVDEGRAPVALLGDGAYARPVRAGDGFGLEVADARPAERPPLAEVPGYVALRA